jgi:hypothetical protein
MNTVILSQYTLKSIHAFLESTYTIPNVLCGFSPTPCFNLQYWVLCLHNIYVCTSYMPHTVHLGLMACAAGLSGSFLGTVARDFVYMYSTYKICKFVFV